VYNLTKRTIVIGLGNPVLGDDGVGWRVAELISTRLEGQTIDVDCLAGGGLSVMERLVGYDAAVLVDAITTGTYPTGSIRTLKLAELENPFAGHLGSAHETNLLMALELGRLLNTHLPEIVWVVAVETPHVYELSEELSPEITDVLPAAVESVLTTLKTIQEDH
jgi:hydrogenase maturation protease